MNATCTTTPSRKILERTISASQNGAPPRLLRLAMLGCEDKPPYGPTEHTASLFLDLICKTLQDFNKSWTVSISIYRVQEFDYPTSQQEWNSYDGIILPGSFSAAYDNDEWIEKLRQVILEEIHGKARPTLGICFGHQVMASAFEDGEAVKNPLGSQAGRRSFPLTRKGKDLLMTARGDKRQELDLYYTHGDMVKRLPTCAVSLGGTDIVPIQAAAYYRSQDEAESSPTRPIAITFQAHPEYASPELGLKKTLGSILEVMQERGDISSDEKKLLRQDSIDHYAVVEQDSIELMKTVGIRLGWFPNEKC